MFCSLCIRFTCTPNFLLRCSARCWAEYTERCWPPVQPKHTDRLVNPRSIYRFTDASTSPYTCSRKYGDFPILFKEADNGFVEAGERLVTFVFARVVYGTAVEYETAAVAGRIFGDTFFDRRNW